MSDNDKTKDSGDATSIDRGDTSPRQAASDSVIGGERAREHQSIQKETQKYHDIGGSVAELLLRKPGESDEDYLRRGAEHEQAKRKKSEPMGLVDPEKGIVYTGKGLLPLIDDELTEDYKRQLRKINPQQTEEDLDRAKLEAQRLYLEEEGLPADQSTGDSILLALDSQPVKETAESWRSRLGDYEESLEKELGHKPTQDDYARIILNTKTGEEEALNATLLYTYGMRSRATTVGKFAETHASGMRDRAKTYKLFPDDLSNLDYQSIHQNFPDSCPFMSPLIGMARTEDGRAKLRKMIKENEDGSFTVTFPGAQDKPIRVGGLTLGEKMLGSSSDQGYIFPAILEKAYGQLLNSESSDKTPIASEGAKHAFDHFTRGLELLTGHEVKSTETGRLLFNPFVDLLPELKRAKKEGGIALLGIKAPPEDERLQGIVQDYHAYLVVGFDDKTVTIRDPVARTPREITVTLDEAKRNFNTLMVEKKKK